MERTKSAPFFSPAAPGGGSGSSSAALGRRSELRDVGGSGRPSFDQTKASARLQKKSALAAPYLGEHDFEGGRSGAGSASPFYHWHSPAASYGSPGSDGGDMEYSRARKGSIRTAVRRIFGRRSREPEPELDLSEELAGSERDSGTVGGQSGFRFAPHRHGYHASEPPRLSMTRGSGEQRQYCVDEAIEEDAMPRTLSVPTAPFHGGDVLRARSPYAVEFPHSARLKPLALGAPFYAPGSRLRRRKTLPSVQVSDADAAAISKAIQSAQEPTRARDSAAPMSERGDSRDGGAGTVKLLAHRKRMSRSADDLHKEAAPGPARRSPSRKRSEDIRFWRESYQGNVSHASGFLLPAPGPVGAREQGQQHNDTLDPFVEPRAAPVPPMTPQMREGELREVVSPSAIGTEMSRDLEDRVAKLESNLQNFSDALRRLTTGQDRELAVSSGSILPSSRPRTAVESVHDHHPNEGRSPSMLIASLELAGVALSSPTPAGPYAHSRGGSGYEPRAPPHPPHTPPPLSTHSRARARSAAATSNTSTPHADIPIPQMPTFHPPPPTFQPPPPPVAAPPQSSLQPSIPPTPQHTFRSLYEMLADERSARRKLETQMRNLRRELMDLQWQVSAATAASMANVPGSGASRANAGSSGQSGFAMEPGLGIGEEEEGPRVVSRFSGESEALGDPGEGVPMAWDEEDAREAARADISRTRADVGHARSLTAESGMF